MSQKRILLAFPIFQAVYPRPFQRFCELMVAAGRQSDYLFGVHVRERSSLVAAMNEVGEMMVSQDWDAVIMFDDDCFPPHDAIPRLLARCFDEGHKFVSGTGVMRGYPFTTTAAKYYPEGVTAEVKPGRPVERLAGFHWLDDLPHALTDVDFCGVPVAIVHKDCFTAVEFPWFADLDEHGRRLTHDVYFCRKLKEAGIPVKVDGTIRCGHLAEAPIITFENRPQARSESA